MSESSWETLKRVLDLWLALGSTVGVALMVLVEFVAGTVVVQLPAYLSPVMLALAIALVRTGRAPPTRPLWTVGLGMFVTAFGVVVLASALGISVSGPVAYLVAIVVVVVVYAAHQGLKSLARSALPEEYR